MFKFCLHEWTNWSNPIQPYALSKKQQWRRCKKCNKADYRSFYSGKVDNYQAVKALEESNNV